MRARKLLVAGLLCGILGASAAEAQRGQQNPPYDAWCRDVQVGLGGGSTMVCRAYTFDQCMASRTSHIETCYLNPLYDPRFADWRKRNPHY